MDYRQEARERFDRVMRVPDRAIEILGLVSFGTLLLLIMETISPSQPRNDFLLFFWTIQIGIYALCGLYFALRFAAAVVIAARAVRHQHRASYRRDVGHPADTQDAPAQTAHLLAADR